MRRLQGAANKTEDTAVLVAQGAHDQQQPALAAGDPDQGRDHRPRRGHRRPSQVDKNLSLHGQSRLCWRRMQHCALWAEQKGPFAKRVMGIGVAEEARRVGRSAAMAAVGIPQTVAGVSGEVVEVTQQAVFEQHPQGQGLIIAFVEQHFDRIRDHQPRSGQHGAEDAGASQSQPPGGTRIETSG